MIWTPKEGQEIPVTYTSAAREPLPIFQGCNGITEETLLTFATRTVFRVRGFSWFRANVEPVASKMAAHIPAMNALRPTRPDWTSLVGGWDATYAPRQIIDAMRPARPKPMILVKALQTLLLCEAAAAAKGVAAADVLVNMRIEPAIFGIQGFTRSMLQQAEAAMPNLWANFIYPMTLQTTDQPIFDMADGKPASLRLASRLRTALLDAVPSLKLGQATPLGTGRKGATESEDVDGPSDPPF